MGVANGRLRCPLLLKQRELEGLFHNVERVIREFVVLFCWF
jgi:hypothetical protein